MQPAGRREKKSVLTCLAGTGSVGSVSWRTRRKKKAREVGRTCRGVKLLSSYAHLHGFWDVQERPHCWNKFIKQAMCDKVHVNVHQNQASCALTTRSTTGLATVLVVLCVQHQCDMLRLTCAHHAHLFPCDVCVWAHCSFLKLRAYGGLPPTRSRSAWSTIPSIVPFPCDLPPLHSGLGASNL